MESPNTYIPQLVQNQYDTQKLDASKIHNHSCASENNSRILRNCRYINTQQSSSHLLTSSISINQFYISVNKLDYYAVSVQRDSHETLSKLALDHLIINKALSLARHHLKYQTQSYLNTQFVCSCATILFTHIN